MSAEDRDPLRNATGPRVAWFDLDHTLLPIDSDVSWGEFTTRIGWTDADEFARRNQAFYEDYKAGRLDIRDYVRFATDAIRQRGESASLAARARFMREVIAPHIRPEALGLVEQHRRAGDWLVIITATNEFVTRPIADAFGVADLIAVELERDASGWISGEIRGVPSAREGKVHRAADWLRARGLDFDRVDSVFYTDSINDQALLERVRRPVATNPDERLRALAQTRGWPVLELFAREPA